MAYSNLLTRKQSLPQSSQSILAIAGFVAAIREARMNELGLTARETPTDPSAFEIIDKAGHIVADIKIRGSVERLQEYLRTAPLPFLGEPDC
jgi:hypothetical protein